MSENSNYPSSSAQIIDLSSHVMTLRLHLVLVQLQTAHDAVASAEQHLRILLGKE